MLLATYKRQWAPKFWTRSSGHTFSNSNCQRQLEQSKWVISNEKARALWWMVAIVICLSKTLEMRFKEENLLNLSNTKLENWICGNEVRITRLARRSERLLLVDYEYSQTMNHLNRIFHLSLASGVQNLDRITLWTNRMSRELERTV